MANTRRPLEEKIALLWHGVHCTGQAKVTNNQQMTTTIDLFRRYGPGSFRELLLHVAMDPGMIYYLDNCVSLKEAIIENWGRELLELFSLGVANYTEDDVKEAARAFTGWTNSPGFPQYPYSYSHGGWRFLYDMTIHDDGQKLFLGQGGPFNGEILLT